MKRVAILLFCVFSLFQMYAQQTRQGELFGQYGFYPFEKDKRFGIKFYGETILYPQYNSLSIETYGYENESCIGTYKIGEKYGLMLYAKPTSKPIFDEATVTWITRDYGKIKDKRAILSIVKTNGKWGVTDIEGNFLIQPEYDFIANRVYYQGDNHSKNDACYIFFLVTKNKNDYMIDLLGRTVLLSDEIQKVVNKSKNIYYGENITAWELFKAAKKNASKINKKSNIDISTIVDKLEQQSEDYRTPVYVTKKVDEVEIRGKENDIQIYHNNNLISSIIYDKAYPQEDGVIRVVKNGKYGLVDCTRGEIIPCQYDYISAFSENNTAIIMERGFEGKVYKSGYISLPHDFLKGDFLLTGDLNSACAYAPENLYLLRIVAMRLFNYERYKEAYELYDKILAKIKTEKIETKIISHIEKARKEAYDYSIGNFPQQTTQESGLDIALGFLNSVAGVANSIEEIKSNENASSGTSTTIEVNSNKQNKEHVNSTNRLAGNYTTLDRTYSNWESRLIDMNINPKKYSKEDFSDIPSIQNKMKSIREKITEMGGTRVQSKWETWKP